MFRKHYRRSTNIVFVIFRLGLSLVMLVILTGGLYSAYKHFSGLDPLKIDPKTLISSLINSKGPEQLISILTSFKLTQSKQADNQHILGQIQQTLPQTPQQYPSKSSKTLAYTFALVADSHSDNLYLRKALAQIKKDYPTVKFLIGLGDYSEVGTIDELKGAKGEFDNAGIRYFLIPGDHDLWDSRNRSLPPITNFKAVFGPGYQDFWEGNHLFILLNNSDNYLGINEAQLSWLDDQLDKGRQADGIHVFIHESLYHPSSEHIMGRVESSLKGQAKSLIQKLKKGGVDQIFAGDIHFFSEYTEPETGLDMVTIGALTSERNTQAPRFAIGKVYSDGSVEVEDVEIN